MCVCVCICVRIVYCKGLGSQFPLCRQSDFLSELSPQSLARWPSHHFSLQGPRLLPAGVDASVNPDPMRSLLSAITSWGREDALVLGSGLCSSRWPHLSGSALSWPLEGSTLAAPPLRREASHPPKGSPTSELLPGAGANPTHALCPLVGVFLQDGASGGWPGVGVCPERSLHGPLHGPVSLSCDTFLAFLEWQERHRDWHSWCDHGPWGTLGQEERPSP